MNSLTLSPSETRKPESSVDDPAAFPSTPWTMVSNVGLENTLADHAIGHLCRIYWYPVYAFVRRRGYQRVDAEDLTQSFFARILERQDLSAVDRGKGRLRNYLLTALNHHLVSWHRKRKAGKRGGGLEPLSIDFERAENRYRNEPRDERSPERLFDRRWATTLLENVMTKLMKEQAAKGKARQFQVLSRFLAFRSGDAPYRGVAVKLGISEGNARVTVHRLRQRYGELLHQEVASTVKSPTEVRDELRHLMDVFSC